MKKMIAFLLAQALLLVAFAGVAGMPASAADEIGTAQMETLPELIPELMPEPVLLQEDEPKLETKPTDTLFTNAVLGGSAEEDMYINDGGRTPVHAMVSFTDDDCRADTYNVLFREVIEPLGIPYTLGLPTGRVGTAGYITQTQLQEMLDAGVSISCHTLQETAMTDYTAAQLDEMLDQWEADAGAMGVGEVLSYAYCNGIWNDEAMPAVKDHFRMGFTVDGGINQMPYESFYMKRVGLFSNKAQALETAVVAGTYLNANATLIKTSNTQRTCSEPIAVREGEEYLLTCSAVWQGACYAVYNSAGKVLEKYPAADTAKGTLLTEHRVKIPEGAAYMRVSHNLSSYPDQAMTVQKLPDSATLAGAKAYVDQVAKEGGWLIFMTHAWYEWFDAEDLKTLVAYIQDAGIPIVDVNEAIRTTGNVIEVGTFRKPLEYAPDPYFVVSAEGRVYTNSLEVPDTPENYENVKLDVKTSRAINGNRRVSVTDPGYVATEYVDVSDCEAILVTGWAYRHTGESEEGYQVYTIKDANYQVLASYTARNGYADGGDVLDHVYVELPEGAAMVMVAGNIYHARPALTKIYGAG